MADTPRRSRRAFLAGGAATVSALLAGCSGSTTESNTTTGTSTTTGTATTTGTTAGGSYAVSMEPVGEVTLDGVPETVAPYTPGYADMAVALGHADAVASVGVPSRYHTDAYAELDGVSVDPSSLTALYQGGIDKEVFFKIGADLHLIDPNWLLNNFKGWEKSDVSQVRERVAPFLGNTIFRRTDAWHDYRYYTMYGAFEKVARVFREGEKFRRFEAFHDDLVGRVQSKLPHPDERPNGALLWAGGNEPEQFSPYRISGQGTNKKQFHDLGITDAFADTGIKGLSTNDRGKIDYEALLDVDPDALFIRGHEHQTRAEFEKTVLAYMKNHDTASQLRAVRNGDVYRGGPIYEGPLQNLFLTERFAKLVYPDAFGDGPLFDRRKLAGIVTA